MSKFASKLSTRHRTRRTLDVNEVLVIIKTLWLFLWDRLAMQVASAGSTTHLVVGLWLYVHKYALWGHLDIPAMPRSLPQDQLPIWWLVYVHKTLLLWGHLGYAGQGVFRRINCLLGGWFMSTKHFVRHLYMP